MIVANDGISGVKAAQEQLPNLIVMDLGLPGLDGWEAARQVRSAAATAHIPIIALTAHTLAEDVSKALGGRNQRLRDVETEAGGVSKVHEEDCRAVLMV